MDKFRDLTDQEILFCHTYVSQGFTKQTEAAKRAGYDCPSEQGYRALAYRLMKRPEIAGYIEQLADELIASNDITIDDIVKELKAVAFANLTDVVELETIEVIAGEDSQLDENVFIGEGGIKMRRIQKLKVKDFNEVAKTRLKGILEIKETKSEHGTSYAVKMHDKLNALKQLREIIDKGRATKKQAENNDENKGRTVLKRRPVYTKD